MKQTVIWLALALLFAIGAALSVTADTFWAAATAEPTAPATVMETPQPVVAMREKPAEPEVPVVLLDDVPPKSAVSSEALARWFVAPGAPPPTRVAEGLLAPSPLAPAKPLAGRPGQDARAGIKPPEDDARPTRKPKDGNAQLPAKKRTANARGCGSSSRFSDLLRQLNLASRCPARRSAA